MNTPSEKSPTATEVAHERPGSGAWTLCSAEMPPENMPVHTKIDDAKGCRNEGVLVLQGRLWWTQDMEMYVYYTPTHWRKFSVHELAAYMLKRCAEREAQLAKEAIDAEREGDTEGCWMAMAIRAENTRTKERIERDLAKLQNN